MPWIQVVGRLLVLNEEYDEDSFTGLTIDAEEFYTRELSEHAGLYSVVFEKLCRGDEDVESED